MIKIKLKLKVTLNSAKFQSRLNSSWGINNKLRILFFKINYSRYYKRRVDEGMDRKAFFFFLK